MLKLGRVQMVVVIINISKIRVTILFWNNAVWLVKTIMWQLQHQNQSALLFLFLNHPRPLFIFVFLMQLIVYKICQWLDSSSLVSKATVLPTAARPLPKITFFWIIVAKLCLICLWHRDQMIFTIKLKSPPRIPRHDGKAKIFFFSLVTNLFPFYYFKISCLLCFVLRCVVFYDPQ